MQLAPIHSPVETVSCQDLSKTAEENESVNCLHCEKLFISTLSTKKEHFRFGFFVNGHFSRLHFTLKVYIERKGTYLCEFRVHMMIKRSKNCRWKEKYRFNIDLFFQRTN